MLRIGLVGAGVIADLHLTTFPHLQGAKVVGVADPLVERAKELAGTVGVPAYEDYRALLDPPGGGERQVDAVWICTPPFLHAEQAIAFAEAGVHVFCEKPITVDLAEADRMIESCRNAGVRLMVGHVIRYYPETLRIKQMLESGEIGDPVFAFGRRLTGATLRELSHWARDPKLSGGFAIESGCHEIDTVRFLGGEVASISARVRYDDPAYPGFDTDYRALMKLRSGAGAEIAESRYSGMAQWVWGVTGTKATAISRRRGQVSLVGMGQEEQVSPVDPVTRSDRVNASMLAENQAFVDAVAGDRAVPIPGEEGRRNVEVILAGHKASRENRVIELS
jgi:predicted dehydrogenase